MHLLQAQAGPGRPRALDAPYLRAQGNPQGSAGVASSPAAPTGLPGAQEARTWGAAMWGSFSAPKSVGSPLVKCIFFVLFLKFDIQVLAYAHWNIFTA